MGPTMAHEASIQPQSYTYTILLEPDEDGGFVVTCPALPGLVTHGDTLGEARTHAVEAIELYLECLQAEGSPIPAGEEHPTETRREPITVKLSYSA
jgi:antitoxin HicB